MVLMDMPMVESDLDTGVTPEGVVDIGLRTGVTPEGVMRVNGGEGAA